MYLCIYVSLSLSVYIYIYVCVCVCTCVYVYIPIICIQVAEGGRRERVVAAHGDERRQAAALDCSPWAAGAQGPALARHQPVHEGAELHYILGLLAMIECSICSYQCGS